MINTKTTPAEFNAMTAPERAAFRDEWTAEALKNDGVTVGLVPPFTQRTGIVDERTVAFAELSPQAQTRAKKTIARRMEVSVRELQDDACAEAHDYDNQEAISGGKLYRIPPTKHARTAKKQKERAPKKHQERAQDDWKAPIEESPKWVWHTENITVPELKALCVEHGLPTNGTKKELIARITEAAG